MSVKAGAGPDDLGLSIVDLMSAADEPVDHTETRAEIRMELKHPANAREFKPDGTWEWVKPPKCTARNLRHIIQQDPEWKGRVKHNAHIDEVEVCGDDLSDGLVIAAKMKIADWYDFEPATEKLHEMFTHVAGLNAYHPVRDYLGSLKWDGVERVDRLLTDYAGADDDDLNRVLSRRFMVACVARAMQPGCKADNVLILAGRQGVGKSTFFRALCGDEWFRDTALDLRNKDAYIALRGAWIYELAELASTRSRDAETVKQFLSNPVDHYRKPYGRTMTKQPRQCVFVGTTNAASFLSDPTGARRFWPVQVNRSPKIIELRRDRDQLWAEAATLYRGHERWFLDKNEEELLNERHEMFQHEDPWEMAIEEWISQPMRDGLTIHEILSGALDMDKDKQHKHYDGRVAGILQRLGWVKKRVTRQGQKRTRWFKP